MANEKFKAVMGNLYGTKPEETECLGCMQPDPPQKLYDYCQFCPIQDCVRKKGFYSCHQCEDWPCALIRNFAFATGRRVMENTIPLWRQKVSELGNEAGSEAWARAVCARYHCTFCGKPLFRGAQKCRACGRPVAAELDGSM